MGKIATMTMAAAPKAAPAAAPKKKENFLIKALNVLDKPGAAVRNTVFEGIDLAQGRGFSVNDISKGVATNKGMAQHLAESGSTLPGWAKAGLGFATDVVLDPLTYLGGAGVVKRGGQSAARQLVDPKVVAALGDMGISPKKAASAAKTIVSGGAGRVKPEVLQALGEVTGTSGKMGIYFRPTGTRIPGSERLAKAAANANADVRTAFVNSKAGEILMKKLGGKAGEAGLTKRIRNGDFSAFEELETMKFMDRARKMAETTMLTQLDQILKPFKKDQGSLTDMRRAIEGDDKALLRMEAQGLGESVADVTKWLSDAGTRARLPKIENYFPRQWSQELRDELQDSFRRGSKDIGPAMKRELVDGTEWMGETLRGTPADIRDQIEAIARSVHGNDYAQVFSDSVPDVLAAYAKQIARREANLAGQDELLRRIGEAPPKPPKVPKSAKKAKQGYQSPAFSGKPGVVGDVEQGALNFDQAAKMAAAGKGVEAARNALRDVDSWALAAAKDTAPWKSQIGDLDKSINKLEDRLAKQYNRTGQMDEAVQARIERLTQQRQTLQNRVDTVEGLLAEDRSFAETLFDSASAAARNAADPQAVAAGVDKNAVLTLNLFPPDDRSVGAVRQALAKPEQLQTVLTGAARRLVDGRNVGEVVDVLQSVGRLNGPGSQNALLRWYDKSNQVLKQYMIFSPGFHVRNAMGGEFNNFVAGVSHQNRQKWHSIWMKSRWGKNPDRLSAADRKIFDQVTSTGTFNQTQAQDVVGAMRGGVSANPLAQNFAPVKGSYEVSGAVEGYLRGSLAYDVIAKGGSVDDAADAVIKFHYDYDDLSGFERGVMKRIIPFYTWTRKNLPLQLEQMVKQPAKYTAYVKAKNSIESLSEGEEVVPGYFGDLGSIRMPWSIGEGKAYWSPDLPFRDVSEYVRPDEPLRGVGMAIGAVTPIIKLPVERWAGKKYFTDSPFFPGHSEAPGSWSKIPGLMAALDAIGMADRGADGAYYMDQRNVYSVEQVVPVLARLHRLAPAGEGDEYMKQRQATNVLSFFGLGVQSNTPEAQKAELKKRKAALQKASKKAKDLGYLE